MSTLANPKGKGGKASTNANNDADTIMPLLFATIGNPTISFKKMAAMDELGRTESSLEHRFRKWRQKGREIAARNPEHAGTLGPPTSGTATTKKPRAPAKKGANDRGKGPIEQAGVEDEEDETDEDARAVKQEPDEMVRSTTAYSLGMTNRLQGSIGGEMLHRSIIRKTIAMNGTKKRATPSQVAAAEEEVGHVPKKKAKVRISGRTFHFQVPFHSSSS